MNTISSNDEIGKRARIPVMPAPHDRTGSGIAADPLDRVDSSAIRVPDQHPTATTDHLAEHAARLARENEALKDLTGLIAHEVKSALLHALLDDEPRPGLMRALELVDTILQAARASQADVNVVAVAEVLHQTISDLGTVNADVTTSATGVFPLPRAALGLVLRNLLANAVAAGAGNIHVSSLAGGERRLLVVDDDGVGLESLDGYATGDQLGLTLCRRLVARFGGAIELKPRPAGGTRAVISIYGADG
ncbi:MAG: Histidine kinase, gyrase and HSP90-like ATPase [Pseudonocardiales bacterium]|jgi:signal transduction histidine kinase|nr:Histidine kinase, gyrase and HSP90-like ATPase [Pseudonocardiales bacterium]